MLDSQRRDFSLLRQLVATDDDYATTILCLVLGAIFFAVDRLLSVETSPLAQVQTT